MTPPVCDAIVLAGGRGTRMIDPEHLDELREVDKPALTIGGRRLVDIALDAVSICDTTVLVGPMRDGVDIRVVQTRESPPGGGPVAALAEGLRCLDAGPDSKARADSQGRADSQDPADLVAVIAADIPLLDSVAVGTLIGKMADSPADAVFARDTAGRTQFLLGVWRRSALRLAVAQLDSVEGAPMRRLVPVDHLIVDVAGIEDCDTRADLIAARLAAQLSESLTVGDALERIRKRLTPLASHRVPLSASAGTVLAEPLLATTALPAVDISAMDGYAVSGAEPWTVRPDIAYAGSSDIPSLTAGTAVRIATGAAVPSGATAVVRDERVTFDSNGSMRRLPAVAQSDDTRRRGEDWMPGTELVAARTPVDAAVRSTAASAEVAELVVRGPVLGRIVISGNEIRSTGPLAPGETRDVLGSVLPEYLAHCGITVVDVRVLDDSAAEFRDVLSRTHDVDIVIVVGATGSGAADQLRSTLAALDAEPIVGRMRVRPGGSQITAALPDGTVVLGLPGNPLAAVSTALLTAPAIVDALTGRTVRPPRTGLLSNAIDVRTSVPRLLPVTADGTRWRADTRARTAHLAHLVGCDALALVPAELSADEPVAILPLPR